MIRVRLSPAASKMLEHRQVSLAETGWLAVEAQEQLAVGTFAERDMFAQSPPPALLILAEDDDLKAIAREKFQIPTDVALPPLTPEELRIRSACLGRVAGAMAANLAAGNLATLGRVAAIVAHEMRNALNCVLSNVVYVREVVGRQGPCGELARAATDAEEGVNRAIAASRTVLEMARGRPAEAGPIDLRTVVDCAIALTKPELFKCVALEVNVGDLPKVHADQNGMVQVLVNLLLNAAEAADTGGRIRVIGALEGERVRLSVADSGGGISGDQEAGLFEPFSSHRGEGTGLGLYVSRKIVERYGGTLTAGPGPLGGAEFSIALPLAEPRSSS